MQRASGALGSNTSLDEGARSDADTSPYYQDDRGWCTGKVPRTSQEVAEFFQDVMHRMFVSPHALQEELEKARRLCP